jgi:uncharacterized protein (DUF1330 family)
MVSWQRLSACFQENMMRLNLKMLGALVAGIAIGAGTIDTLRAQSKAPIYVVTDFADVMDPTAFAAASKGVPSALQAAGAKLLVRTDGAVALDGTAPKRFAIFQFESVEKAKAWYASDAMKETQDARAKLTKSRTFLVEGVAN